MAKVFYIEDIASGEKFDEIKLLTDKMTRDYTEENVEKYISNCNELVKNSSIGTSKGDIIQLEERVEHDNTKLLWNGSSFIDLCSDVDDYGSIPPLAEFCAIEKFSIYHWENAITHNSLVPFNHQIYKDQILESHRINKSIKYCEETTSTIISTASFIHIGKCESLITHLSTYTIFYEWDTEYEMTIEEMNDKLSTLLDNNPTCLYFSDYFMEDYDVDGESFTVPRNSLFFPMPMNDDEDEEIDEKEEDEKEDESIDMEEEPIAIDHSDIEMKDRSTDMK
jgi:hypothetical protein